MQDAARRFAEHVPAIMNIIGSIDVVPPQDMPQHLHDDVYSPMTHETMELAALLRMRNLQSLAWTMAKALQWPAHSPSNA